MNFKENTVFGLIKFLFFFVLGICLFLFWNSCLELVIIRRLVFGVFGMGFKRDFRFFVSWDILLFFFGCFLDVGELVFFLAIG